MKRKRFTTYNMSRQLRVFFEAVFLLVFLLCVTLYSVLANSMMNQTEDITLHNRLELISINLDALLSNANSNSKTIAYNEDVQNSLSLDTQITTTARTQLQETVNRMVACCNDISSIYLFNTRGDAYIAGNIREVDAVRQRLLGAENFSSSFEMMKEMNGGRPMLLCRTDIAENNSIISYARVVRNLQTLKPLGVLVVNIPIQKFRDCYVLLAGMEGLEVAILDEEGNVIVTTDADWLADCVSQNMPVTEDEDFHLIEYNGQNYKVGKMNSEDSMYQVIIALPRNSTLLDMNRYIFYTAIILLFGIGLSVGGAYIITRKIRRPLENILSSMKKVRSQELEIVQLCEANREINELQMGYNRMILDMEELINHRIENQRLRRKYELDLLQAQIKPHFLYNTLDSVCALALMGDIEDIYKMVQALGKYYRNSLHRGKDIITIGEELEIVENYLIIQNYRYDDVFKPVYDIDESVKQYSIIKLTLQPLVENAIYHGFRDHELTGTITIRAKDAGDYVMLAVEDDGAGMPPERLAEVLCSTDANRVKRFGLFGTMERLKLYYGETNLDVISIHSEYGKGTIIQMRIPKQRATDEN